MKKYTIGFNTTGSENEAQVNDVKDTVMTSDAPRKSVVRIYFSERNMTLSYYNDKFDLRRGDLVYVDGKLEGMQGEVVDVNYSFKIKLSEYKRVISVVDTDVRGEMYFTGSHILTFDRTVLPYEKIITWFKAPENEDDEYATGEDNTSFPLDDLSEMGVTQAIAERGEQYYFENRVCYICLDGGRGKAVVRGTEYYDVDFTYTDGAISNLVCSCFCSYPCKHEFAAMLQLKECLDNIAKEYESKHTDYFAAVSKGVLMNKVVSKKTKGKLILSV